jgi:hypothetical protein
VKGIYAGLVMVEGRCIQVDAKQAALARETPPGTQPKLNNEQWQALIALHRTLLHEHHDFFLASQHPSATPAVRRLAIKYAMPARLWRHGIHSFLELLRNRLPDSLDHMLAFIYLAYSMMTLLYETVPAFEETWIECLGDLGRYRMAIEDDDIKDREVWTSVARQWYLKASDRAPETGRLYHHLAILARPNALQHLFFYYKALSVPQPYTAAKESILALLQPVLNGSQARRLPVVITTFVKIHAILSTRKPVEDFSLTLLELQTHLDGHIARVTRKYLEQGYYIAISNCVALLAYGRLDVDSAKDDCSPANATLSSLQECVATSWRRFLRRFTSTARYLGSLGRGSSRLAPFLLLPVSLQFIDSACAAPTRPLNEGQNRRTVGFTLFWETKAKNFADEMAGPLLLNVCLAITLALTHICVIRLHRGPCKEWDLLPIIMIATSLGLFYLIMSDESLSGWQIAM